MYPYVSILNITTCDDDDHDLATTDPLSDAGRSREVKVHLSGHIHEVEGVPPFWSAGFWGHFCLLIWKQKMKHPWDTPAFVSFCGHLKTAFYSVSLWKTQQPSGRDMVMNWLERRSICTLALVLLAPVSIYVTVTVCHGIRKVGKSTMLDGISCLEMHVGEFKAHDANNCWKQGGQPGCFWWSLIVLFLCMLLASRRTLSPEECFHMHFLLQEAAFVVATVLNAVQTSLKHPQTINHALGASEWYVLYWFFLRWLSRWNCVTLFLLENLWKFSVNETYSRQFRPTNPPLLFDLPPPEREKDSPKWQSQRPEEKVSESADEFFPAGWFLAFSSWKMTWSILGFFSLRCWGLPQGLSLVTFWNFCHRCSEPVAFAMSPKEVGCFTWAECVFFESFLRQQKGLGKWLRHHTRKPLR